jgi:hypothetical protein
MTEPHHHSPDASNHPAALLAADLLRYYNFELETCAIDQQIAAWLTEYSAKWIQQAVVEALYQGRYKVISVRQILALWQRRSQPVNRFTGDFERLVCNKIPRTAIPQLPQPIQPPPQQAQPSLSYRKMLLQLPSLASRLERLPNIPTLQITSPTESLSANTHNHHPFTTSPINAFLDQDSSNLETSDSAHSNILSTEPKLFEAEKGNQTLKPLNLTIQSPEHHSSNGKSADAIAQDQEFKKFKMGVLFALSSGLAPDSLHPRLRLELSQRYSLNWHHFDLASNLTPDSPAPDSPAPDSPTPDSPAPDSPVPDGLEPSLKTTN